MRPPAAAPPTKRPKPDPPWFGSMEVSRFVLGSFLGLDPRRFFVDLAANHPTLGSTTYPLEQHGWRGLCIEAQPEYVAMLRANRSCAVAPVAVDGVERDVQFAIRGEMGGIVDTRFDNRIAGDQKPIPLGKLRLKAFQDQMHALNATSGAAASSSSNGAAAGDSSVAAPPASSSSFAAAPTITLRTRRLDDVLREFKVPRVIDYLNLDVEGAESSILSSSHPWGVYRFLTLSVERPPPDLALRLFAHGYLYVMPVGHADEVFVHRSHPRAKELQKNETYRQGPAKCRTFEGAYRDRAPLRNLPGFCKSIFGCCHFPGFPQSTTKYKLEHKPSEQVKKQEALKAQKWTKPNKCPASGCAQVGR